MSAVGTVVEAICNVVSIFCIVVCFRVTDRELVTIKIAEGVDVITKLVLVS